MSIVENFASKIIDRSHLHIQKIYVDADILLIIDDVYCIRLRTFKKAGCDVCTYTLADNNTISNAKVLGALGNPDLDEIAFKRVIEDLEQRGFNFFIPI